MEPIVLSSSKLFIYDLIYWLFFQGVIGFIAARLPMKKFDPEKKLYQTRSWEKNGKVYEEWFHIRKWKHLIWDAGKVFQKDFSKDHVDPKSPEMLRRWIIETCRAEWCHWVTFFFIIPLFITNPPGMINFWLIYDILLNIVPIIVQRYNRPRLIKLLNRFLPTKEPSNQHNHPAIANA